MGLLARLERAAEAKSVSYGETFDTTSPKLAALFGQPTVTGKLVNDTTAMQVTTVWACVRLLAETMGAMPSGVFRQEKNGNAEKIDHPLSEVLIQQPNLDMNGLEAREAWTANLALRGNSYALIERRGSGDVLSLYPVPSAAVARRRDSGTDWETRYGFADRGKMEWYPAEKVWHVKGFSFNGLEGLSPIACAREAMALALAGEEFNARLFAQGLMPSARVSIPNWLTPEQRTIAEKKIEKMHQGVQNLGRPMLLEGGMKVESGLLTPDDAQFLQLRQFTVVELCRLFGVKPHMIAALERATDNNIEKLSLEFVMYTMLPYMRRFEMAAARLFKPGDRGRYFYRFNADGLLRADSVARAQLYSILLQNGVVSRNEVRALENRNRSEADGMDDYSVQMNMTLIQFLEQMARANAAAAGGS